MIKIVTKTVEISSLCEYKFWHNLQLSKNQGRQKKQGRHNYLANHNTALFVTFQNIFVKTLLSALTALAINQMRSKKFVISHAHLIK